MPTVTQIVTQIAPISNYLASNDIANGALFGQRVNTMLPLQLWVETETVRDRFDMEDIEGGETPSQELRLASNYLYALCGRYGQYALSFSSSGGTIPSTSGGADFAPKLPIIGVAGDGGVDDPIIGVYYYQNDKLKNLGSTNNWRIQAVILKVIMDNFEPNPDFSYNPITGTLTNLPFAWEAGNTIYVDRNQ